MRKIFIIIASIITFSLGVVNTSNAQNSIPNIPPGKKGGYVIPKAVTCARSEWLMEGTRQVGEKDAQFVGVVSAETPGSAILHIYKNPKTGTFSVIESFSNGVSCLISHGHTPEAVTDEKPEPQNEKMKEKMKFKGPFIEARKYKYKFIYPVTLPYRFF